MDESSHRPDVFKTNPETLKKSNRSRKSDRITIRLNKEDLQKIRDKANDAGMPYQTLISAILHQYVVGKLNVKL